MPVEIERKFLVPGDFPSQNGTPLQQAYLSLDPQRTVRVRIAGDHALLTIKGTAQGISRPEFEYPLPLEDAPHGWPDGRTGLLKSEMTGFSP